VEYRIRTRESVSEISEEEFFLLVSVAGRDFFRTFHCLHNCPPENLTKNDYSEFAQISHVLETFLDDHGARNNRGWAYFVELVASLRNLTICAYIMRHILDRQADYHCGKDDWTIRDFVSESCKALTFLNRSIVALGDEAVREARAHSVKVEGPVFKCQHTIEEVYRLLPQNMTTSVIQNEEERIVNLIHKVRKVAKISALENIKKTTDPGKLLLMVPARYDEKKARKLKNIVHGVQSDYDTYVKNTDIEQKNPNLKLLRGSISIPMHLLEMVRWLSHFYERHENSIRTCAETNQVAAIVDKMQVLHIIINYGFYYADQYLRQARKVSEGILNNYVKTVRYEIPVPSRGFHARPSTYVSLIVNEHGTNVFLVVDEQKFNAKSVMDLMMAAGLIYDKGLQKVIFEGDKRVLDDIKVLAENNYCEDGEIPRALNYLKVLRNVGAPVV